MNVDTHHNPALYSCIPDLYLLLSWVYKLISVFQPPLMDWSLVVLLPHCCKMAALEEKLSLFNTDGLIKLTAF